MILFNKKSLFVYFICIFILSGLILLEAQTIDNKSENTSITGPQIGKAPYIPRKFRKKFKWKMEHYQLPWVVLDRNRDGEPDAATLVYEENYHPHFEILDIDFDGKADDFAFFDAKGQLEYQIIDSDKNGESDLWVQVKSGRFVQRFQQDKDGDGLIDVDRIYDKSLILNR